MAHKEPSLVGRWLLSSVVKGSVREFNPLTVVKTSYESAHLVSQILKVVHLLDLFQAFFYP